MNFNQVKSQDILKITRKGDFSDILNAYQMLEYHGEELEDFAENKTTALLLESEALELWEVEQFAGENGLCKSEENCSKRFDSLYEQEGVEFDTSSVVVEFSIFLDGLKAAGEIHQLQYDNYKYVGKWSK